MKRIKSILLCLVATISFLSMANAQRAIETRNLDEFHGVSVGSIVSAELQRGNSNKIEIEVDGFELSDVTTKLDNGVLKVGMKNKTKKFNWSGKNKVNVVITYTEDPDEIAVSSSADIVGKNTIKREEVRLSVSGSGDMTIDVDVAKLMASVSSSGDLTIRGKATTATVSASSSADFEGAKLIVQDAQLSASSSADITIHVENSLKASASSSSDITYLGSPKQKDISKSGQADVDGH